MFDFVNLIWSYIEKNEVTKLISLLVIFILFLCLLWEFFSLYSSWRETKKYRKLIKSQDETSFELSPLKPRHDGVQYVRALPQFILNGPRRSKIRYFTTVLTSLGVMGTFMGIMIGLAGIDQKLSGDTSQTFAAVKDLLGGMSTAFITSIVGMVSSLILLVILSLFDKLKHAFHYSLVDTFFKHYCVETLGDYLKNIGGEGQQELLEKQLEVAAKSEQASDALLQMGKSLEKSAENFDADKIGQHISSSLDNIFRTEMVPVFKEISQELSELRAIKQDNGEALLNAIKNEIVTPLTEEIRNTAELVKGSTLAINKLNEDLGDISIKLGESVATIQTFQRETMTELKGFAGDLRDILSGFQTDTKQILEGVADSIRAAVDQSIAGMEDQRDAFKESAQDAAQTFKDIKAELVEALDHQTGLQQSLLNETAKRFDDVNQ
ncbi:MAG: MotA/TolQ/ExbB proton channel family protein, partial [Paraglaciecola sp.]|nr:MotA/TolQ/ExbB proton channel family protein [Paraglaciecola sp.]